MKKFITLLIAVLIAVVAIGMLLGRTQPVPSSLPEWAGEAGQIPQLSLEGFSEAGIDLDPGSLSILLSSGCKEIRMVTSQEQIYSIARGLEGGMEFRPLPHDLIGNIAGEFGIEVLMVKVESLRKGTYYAKLILGQGNKILNMDSRPSDAIAVALRTGSPVYVRQEIMEEYGMDIC